MSLLALVLSAFADDGQVHPGSPHYDLEVLYHQGRFVEGLAQTDERIAATPDDKDLYWTRARFLFEIAEVPSDASKIDTSKLDKEAHYSDMLATAERGLSLAPGDPGLRFARGVAKARLGTTRGVLSSLFMAKSIEQDWLFVVEHPTYRYASIGGVQVLPCDAIHALGIFYRMVPDRWLVSVLAGTRGDLDRSLALHERAVACKPDEIKNWKELGVTQLCIGTSRGGGRDEGMLAAGRASLERGLAVAGGTPKDQIDRVHSKQLIADPKLACGYSRDGQQDLDTASLEASHEPPRARTGNVGE